MYRFILIFLVMTSSYAEPTIQDFRAIHYAVSEELGKGSCLPATIATMKHAIQNNVHTFAVHLRSDNGTTHIMPVVKLNNRFHIIETWFTGLWESPSTFSIRACEAKRNIRWYQNHIHPKYNQLLGFMSFGQVIKTFNK